MWTSALEARLLSPDERFAIEPLGTRARRFYISERLKAEPALTLDDLSSMPEWAFYPPARQAHLARICGATGLTAQLKITPDGAVMRQVAKLIGVRALDALLAGDLNPTGDLALRDAGDEARVAIKGYEMLKKGLTTDSSEQTLIAAAVAALPVQSARRLAA